MAEATPALADLVYVVRPGDDNEELRFSLRSVAANLKHRKVWVVGHCPQWVTNVETIELDPLPDKYDNIVQSLRAACECDEITDTFIGMNDDYFVMKPVDQALVYHGTTLRELEQWFLERGKAHHSPYLVGIRNTLRLLEQWGHDNPLSYELHAPLPMNRQRLREVLERAADISPFLPWQAYPAYGADKGVRGYDSKNEPELVEAHGLPYLSSYDRSFAREDIGRRVRAAFPKPCKYEK